MVQTFPNVKPKEEETTHLLLTWPGGLIRPSWEFQFCQLAVLP